MEYEFYADVFFLTNFYLDFLAVIAVGEILQQKKKLLRAFLCCVFGSLAGCILFLSVGNYDVYLLCVHFILNPIITFACFFPAERKIYTKAFCLMYFVILLLGGSMEWLYHTAFGGRFYELCLLLTTIPIAVLLFILRRKRENVQRIYRVFLMQEGRETSLYGLYDTGNGLMDPYVKEPVHIVSKSLYEALGGQEKIPSRLLPFSSVGCKSGMLPAFTVECLRIVGENAEYEISPAVLAAAEDSVFSGREYQMILNVKSLNRKEEKTCT